MSHDVQDLRARFRDGRCHLVVVPGVVVETVASAIRAHLDELGFETFYEPDRGRHEINDNLVVPELFAELRELIEAIVERPLQVGPAHWLRLRHRDYALMKNDAKSRVAKVTYIEATLDFSAQAIGQGETVYTDGTQSWVIPQEPGSLAVVEREPWLFRYDRYLDHHVTDALVYRLRLALL